MLTTDGLQINVLFFGILRDLAGRGSDALTLREGATIADLLAHCERQIPRLKPYLPAVATAVNQEYAARSRPLQDQDEVALLPPVSGGGARTALLRAPIEPQAVISGIQRPEDGAVAVFEGVVRDHSRGRRTLFLEYDAYEPMALKELENLAAQALGNFAIRDVRIVHRLGRLEIGEVSVLIVVAAGHRAAALDACRWLIDTLKRTIPIWKKEHFADGAVWADGEPFPENLSAGPGSASK